MSIEVDSGAKTICFVLIFIFAILASCALLALALVGVSLGPDIGTDKYFADDSNYQTFDVKIVEAVFYDNAISLMIDHANPNFGDGMVVTRENAVIAMENGAKDILKENAVVTVTAAPKFIGGDWYANAVAIKAGDVEILSYETGKANIVARQEQTSRVGTITLSVAAAVAAVAGIGVGITIYVAKKKNLFK